MSGANVNFFQKYWESFQVKTLNGKILREKSKQYLYGTMKNAMKSTNAVNKKISDKCDQIWRE